MAFNFNEMSVMKRCIVTDVIKPVTDTNMAILGCLIHLPGCKPGRATLPLVLLTAQAGLNLGQNNRLVCCTAPAVAIRCRAPDGYPHTTVVP